MSILKENEWEKINQIIIKINDSNNITKLKKVFLQEVRKLIYFDLGDYCMCKITGHEAVNLIDPVVVSKYPKVFEQLFNLTYERQFGQADYTKWIVFNKDSMVYKESELISLEARQKSTYFQNYLKPTKLTNVIGMTVCDNGVCLGVVSLYRTDKHGDYTERDKYILEQLRPHLNSKMISNLNAEQRELGNKHDKVNSLYSRKYGLTKREVQILIMVSQGKGYKDIAESIFISVNTVKKHMTSIFVKFHVKNRVQLINFLIQNEKDIFIRS